MALYKTHVHFNLFIFLPILGLILYLIHTSYQLMAISGLSFVYATLFMNPDADLARKNKLFSFKGLMTFPFRSYSFFFHHRGLSHHPILGSFTRIFWLGIFVLIITFLIDLPSLSLLNGDFVKKYQQEWLFSLIGIFTADLGHLALDWHS